MHHLAPSLAFMAGLSFNITAAVADDAARRTQLKTVAANEFTISTNHCKSFAKVAEAAAKAAPSVGAWLEDMRLVIIGSDWSRKDRGAYWSGVKTGDSGFKASLKDGSSQVEHAMAAVYLGNGLPALLTTFGGVLNEVTDAFQRGGPISTADIALWAIGEDIGAHIYDGNLTQVGTAIRNSMCE